MKNNLNGIRLNVNFCLKLILCPLGHPQILCHDLCMGSIHLIIVVSAPLSDTTTTIINALMALVLLPRILQPHLPCPIRFSLLAFNANYVRSLVILLWRVGIGLTLIFLLILMLILLNFILQIMNLVSHLCWVLHLLFVILFGTQTMVLLIV